MRITPLLFKQLRCQVTTPGKAAVFRTEIPSGFSVKLLPHHQTYASIHTMQNIELALKRCRKPAAESAAVM